MAPYNKPPRPVVTTNSDSRIEHEPTTRRSYVPAAQEAEPDYDGDLKVDINNLVWQRAPAEMPLGKADELACEIFALFLEARKQYRSEAA